MFFGKDQLRDVEELIVEQAASWFPKQADIEKLRPVRQLAFRASQ